MSSNQRSSLCYSTDYIVILFTWYCLSDLVPSFMTGNQCGWSSYTKISRRTIKFKEISRISRRVLNSSRFPGFPGVVDTMRHHLFCRDLCRVGQFSDGPIQWSVHFLHLTLVASAQLFQVADTDTTDDVITHDDTQLFYASKVYEQNWVWTTATQNVTFNIVFKWRTKGYRCWLIIIIIIKHIYIAQICRKKTSQMTRVHNCMSNRKVFSLFLKVSIAMSGSRSSAGRLFQTRDPWVSQTEVVKVAKLCEIAQK